MLKGFGVREKLALWRVGWGFLTECQGEVTKWHRPLLDLQQRQRACNGVHPICPVWANRERRVGRDTTELRESSVLNQRRDEPGGLGFLMQSEQLGFRVHGNADFLEAPEQPGLEPLIERDYEIPGFRMAECQDSAHRGVRALSDHLAFSHVEVFA